MNSICISELCDRYVEHLATAGSATMASVRSNLRRLLCYTDQSEPASAFLMHIDQRIGTLSNASPPTPQASVRVIRSHLRAAVRWALDEGLISVSSEMTEHLGLVPANQFAHWRDHPKALTVYKVLIAEIAVGGMTVAELDEDYLAGFAEQLPDRISGWRSCWSAFTRRWRELSAEGVMPEMEFLAPPSKKPSSYAVRESDLPIALGEELRLVKARLEGAVISDRAGVPPLDESTRRLVLGTVMRLLGFLASERGFDLGTLSLRDALKLENVQALLAFTSERYYSRMGLLPERDSSGRILFGEHELGILRQLAAVVRLGLCNDRLHAEYAGEVRFAAVGVRNRRESKKTAGAIDDYYRVAAELTTRALHKTERRGMTPEVAIMIRDALIFSLLAAHGYRRSLLAMLDLKKSVRESVNGLITVCVPREHTKPGIRDLQLELPRELLGLWRLYLGQARQMLLSGRRSSALFIAQGGSALGDNAIYTVVFSRSEELLGARHNPHQARKALATDYGLWSSGDYLSASAVLDSSPLTLQRHYADLRREERIADFDAATSDDWQRATGGNAA